MTDKQVENYLKEIHRVLKPKGRCLATFFILNDLAKDDSNSEFLCHNFGFYVQTQDADFQILDLDVQLPDLDDQIPV